MARSVRDKDLLTRTARLRLKARHQPYWVMVAEGLSIGYRRAGKGSGKFQARLYVGGQRYSYKALGKADDYEDANGTTVLTFYQAQELAREISQEADSRDAPKKLSNATVAGAKDEYLIWFRANRKSVRQTEDMIDAHISKQLGRIALRNLTTKRLRDWLNKLAVGRKPATANRNLNVLKAILNFAWQEGMVESDAAWRRVKPFHNVSEAKVRFFSVEESNRLTNACGPEFRRLVRAALLTGARYGELGALSVGDYSEDAASIYIADSKSGKPRHIPLSPEGQEFFDEVTAGRKSAETMFLRHDGLPWGKSHQARPLKDACKQAEIDPPASFHVLRHTYASLLAREGVPLQVIAAALGHSDTRITEKHYAHLKPDYVAEVIQASLPRFQKSKTNVRKLRASR